jgi:hypothetical protein
VVDYTRVRSVMRTAEGRLLLLPGVHAIGVGPKTVGGQRTDEPSIIVFLVKKKPQSELAPEDVVPAEIDGVKTDVIEMPVPRPYVDVNQDRVRPLAGGISLEAKDQWALGTLSFFGHTGDPTSKVVAITNQHVVDPPHGSAKSSVKVTVPPGSPNPYTISFSIQGTTTTGSLVLVSMIDPASSTKYNAWWRVTATDTAATIATNVLAAVNAVGAAGVSAAIGAQPTSVVITTAPGGTTQVAACTVYDPAVVYPDANLIASMSGNVITLSGTVGGDYCAYVTWNTNGGDPTQGVLTLLPKGTSVADAATAIAASITNRAVTGITATATPTTVTVAGAAQVGCAVLGDQRVGQPNDSFSSDCSMCCANEMGRVLAADLSTDAALIQVRAKFQYLNEIVGGNPPPADRNMVITGVYSVTDADVHASYEVHKRGIRTGYTSGIVTALAMSGYIAEYPDNNAWTVFHRFYKDAMVIEGSGGSTFSDQGDSGSALFDDAGNVVGILFGGGGTQTIATPIDQITSALNITVATSTALKQVQTVSDAQGAPAAVAAADNELVARVLTTQAEITSTPTGKRYAELVTRHAREVQGLVNENRRVTIAWHRNGGPQILRAALRFVGQREEHLPQEIDGEPLAERLSRIRDALARYGSTELSRDLSKYGQELLDLTSLSYTQALERMRSSDRAGADAD